MNDPIKKRRRELAEDGVEQTPAEVEAWFADAQEFFRAGGIDIPPEQLVDTMKQMKEMKEKFFPGR